MHRLKSAPKHANRQEYVTCAFCKGHGTDPFNVMSMLSVCGACQGTGQILTRVPHMRCVYCEGSGSYKTYSCPVCHGSGVVSKLEGRTVVCPDCRGRAADGSSGLVCLTCRGRGAIPTSTGSTE